MLLFLIMCTRLSMSVCRDARVTAAVPKGQRERSPGGEVTDGCHALNMALLKINLGPCQSNIALQHWALSLVLVCLLVFGFYFVVFLRKGLVLRSKLASKCYSCEQTALVLKPLLLTSRNPCKSWSSFQSRNNQYIWVQLSKLKIKKSILLTITWLI